LGAPGGPPRIPLLQVVSTPMTLCDILCFGKYLLHRSLTQLKPPPQDVRSFFFRLIEASLPCFKAVGGTRAAFPKHLRVPPLLDRLGPFFPINVPLSSRCHSCFFRSCRSFRGLALRSLFFRPRIFWASSRMSPLVILARGYFTEVIERSVLRLKGLSLFPLPTRKSIYLDFSPEPVPPREGFWRCLVVWRTRCSVCIPLVINQFSLGRNSSDSPPL